MLPPPRLGADEQVQDVDQAIEEMAEEIPIAEVVLGRIEQDEPIEARDEAADRSVHVGQTPDQLVAEGHAAKKGQQKKAVRVFTGQS